MSRLTQDTPVTNDIYAYGTFTPCGAPFQKTSASYHLSLLRSFYPITAETIMVWALPLSIATSQGITIVFSSSGY